MYSYPPEYLHHPVPVLAVYGLSTTEEPKLVDVESSNNSSRPTSGQAFNNSLLKMLTNKSEYSIYEATRYLANNQVSPPFRVITVSKDYVLPQKPLPATPNLPPPHSNLSPLSQDSSLYPDGIMTPLWMKKHLYLPSVIVGFYELWDWTTEPGNTSRPHRETGPLASQVLIDPTEREHDATLTTEINTKRKYFQDKGIKFAAVIVLKQKTTDPSIEERLSLIKRQCGLDNKSSFFTVAPGSSNEMQEFINGLFRALFEPSLQFYNNRLKKLRKKRSKLPSPTTVPRTALDLSTAEPQPLSVIGWMLRYDIKAAFFQETRQELDGALKSYENAYAILSEMLSPNAPATNHNNLIIHGQRWKDARVLVDCINLKICKFYLYLNDPTAALAQLNSHLHMFQSYSPSWGMGERTFEYWAWLSKQYRIFADIIDTAIQAGYKIPLPTEYLNTGAPGSPLMNSTNTSMITSTSGLNPGSVLQHPGFYYHLAAMCCAERRRRFLEFERSEATSANEHTKSLLQKEKLVDHSNLTIELLTKSYEQFKRYRNGRMTLYLAAEIAGTYYETGKFEMALKFFERIGKTYRKEKWHMVLTSILRWSLRCAKELGSSEKAVECLVELLSDELPMAEAKRHDIQKEFMDILNSPRANVENTPPSPLVLKMDQISCFVSCQVQIKNKTNFVGAPVEYQIFLNTSKTSPPVPFRFNAVRILFSDPKYNVILKDNGSEGDLDAVEIIDFSGKLTKITEEGDYLNWNTAQADLRICQNQIKALQSYVTPEECGELKIAGVCLDIITDHWQIELNYDVEKFIEESPGNRRKWLESYTDKKPVYKILDGRGYLSTSNILQKPPSIELKFDHAAPALLDELFKLDVTIESSENETVEAILCAEIKNSEGVVADDYITFSLEDDDQEKAASKESAIGTIEPGKSIVKPIYLHGGNVTGSRLINVTVKYTIAGNSISQRVEKSESLRIPFIAPFDVNFELCAQSSKMKKNISPDLEKTERWLLVSAIRCFSAWDLNVKSVGFEEDKSFSDPYTSLSLVSKDDDFKDQIWKTGHVYNVNYLYQLTTTDITEEQKAVPAGNIIIEWKRAGEENGNFYQSIVRLPSIQFQQQGLVVLADVPSEIYLGEPFTLAYTIHNPTQHLADYNASVELSEAFVFSGYKQFKGRVLPLSRTTYHYTCYPLLAGKVKLPKLKVMASQQQSGEREVPVEIAGSGITIALNNDLQQRQPGTPTESAQPILAFVNAKRRL